MTTVTTVVAARLRARRRLFPLTSKEPSVVPVLVARSRLGRAPAGAHRRSSD